jgi:sugar phosphate permease
MGALMLGGGLVGAVLIPTISDRIGKRTPFLSIGFLCAIPGLIGVTFAQTNWLLFISAFFLGFFLISASPIGMQYAAEITYPTPEGTSNGLIQLFGQVSVVYVYIMEALKNKNGEFYPAMMLSIGLLVLSSGITLLMKDSKRRIG